MKELYPLKGIITTVISPFRADAEKSIDWDSFRKEITTCKAAGVAGFLVPCLASEVAYLTLDEITKEVSETVAIAHGGDRKAVVIANVTSPDKEVRLEQCRRYLALGVDGINLNMPYTTDEEYLAMVKEIDDMNPPFLCLQDIDLQGPGKPVEILVRAFKEFDSVRCAKVEVKDSGPKYTRLLKATEGKMVVGCAWGSSQSIEAYDRGVHMLLPSGLPELFVNVFNLYHAGKRDKAMELFFAMLPIISFTRQSEPLNRFFHKCYFKRIGVFSDAVSREDFCFDEYQARYAKDLIEYAVKLRDSIPSYWQ